MLAYLRRHFGARQTGGHGGLEIMRHIGPGLLVTVGFIDPGNWASNMAAGSEFGYSLLWVVTLSTLMLIVLQHNAAHLGIATGACLAEATTRYLPRIVGYARAAEALMTARRIGAEELKEWGFANKVVADEDVVEEAVKMAEAMVKNSAPLGLRLTKESLQVSLDNSFESQIKMENRNQVLASQTEDNRRGVRKMNPKLRDEVKAHPENFAFSNM